MTPEEAIQANPQYFVDDALDRARADQTRPTLISQYDGDWRKYLTQMVGYGDAAAADKLLSYMMSEESNDRARQWTASREDTQYQRLVADLRAAGINPYILMNSGGSPVSSSADGSSYSGSQFTTKKGQEESARHNQTQDALKIFSTLLSTLAIAIAVAI